MRWSQLDDIRGAQIEWCQSFNVPIGAAVDSTHLRCGITIGENLKILSSNEAYDKQY